MAERAAHPTAPFAACGNPGTKAHVVFQVRWHKHVVILVRFSILAGLVLDYEWNNQLHCAYSRMLLRSPLPHCSTAPLLRHRFMSAQSSQVSRLAAGACSSPAAGACIVASPQRDRQGRGHARAARAGAGHAAAARRRGATKHTHAQGVPFWFYKGWEGFPFDITRDERGSLLLLQGMRGIPFQYYKG